MNDLKAVRVTNYQSIGSADIEIGGLTVIVGRGDLGKSALLRAISAALFNETGSDFIRHGEKKCTVELVFDKDSTVTWIKDGNGARYECDIAGTPITFTKLAGGVPTELQDMFGVKAIKIDDTFTIRPQVHDQFDAPILLAESSGKAARALAKLTKLEAIMSAQMAAAKDLRKAKQDVTARQRERDELAERLKDFPDFENVDALMASAKNQIMLAGKRLDRLVKQEDALLAYEDALERSQRDGPTGVDVGVILERLEPLEEQVLAYAALLKAYVKADSCQVLLMSAEANFKDAERDLEEAMEGIDICPFCGQEMSEEHHD